MEPVWEGPQCPRNGLTKRVHEGFDAPAGVGTPALQPDSVDGGKVVGGGDDTPRIRSGSGFVANTAEGGCATERGGEEL